MDTAKTTSHVGLCAGYGGIELGLKRVIPNLRSVAICEIEAFACANLVAKMEAGLMDPAPIWTDLKTFPWAEFRERVDILTGGYPCQPFSSAGLRRGKDDPRHLWPWIADGIRLMRPRICFFENVEGHISMGLSDVIEDLVAMGYRVSWGIFSASEVGAPHQRKRMFILANRNSKGLERSEFGSIDIQKCYAGEVRERQAWPARPGEAQHGWEPPRVVADTYQKRCREKRTIGKVGGTQKKEGIAGNQSASPTTDCSESGKCEAMGNAEGARTGIVRQGIRPVLERSDEAVGDANSEGSQKRKGPGGQAVQGIDSDGREIADREVESSMGGNADGPSSGMDNAELYNSCDNRTDELRLLGNGVVPATAEKAFRVLLEKLMQ